MSLDVLQESSPVSFNLSDHTVTVSTEKPSWGFSGVTVVKVETKIRGFAAYLAQAARRYNHLIVDIFRTVITPLDVLSVLVPSELSKRHSPFIEIPVSVIRRESVSVLGPVFFVVFGTISTHMQTF